MDGQLLTPEELAEICQVPLATTYQWNYRKVGPKFLKVGKHVRYRRTDVDRWLEDRERGGHGVA